MTDDVIKLGHGGGGLLSRQWIAEEISTRFGQSGPLREMDDGARLALSGANLVFATDSFVVSPLFFPGGDIGSLSVHGTVNDLAVCGAVPRWLSLALIIEEGFATASLRRILDSLQAAAVDCGVQVVTGDTKVVRKGQCDGMYINTAGIGEPLPGFALSPSRLQSGDAVLVSGTLGDHGMAILAARESLPKSDALQSDAAPVHRLVQAIAHLAPHVRFMRDPTRGGAAATLNEIVADQPVGIELVQGQLPFHRAALSLAEMLGIDLLHVASEGRMLLVCAPEAADEILATWRRMPEGAGAACIGEVINDPGRVLLRTDFGGRRVVDVPMGELLPRIC
ncbi:MAG: hydrogenase expression/formation protein HypE [Proteobacteria bacterium]|nr:hydrogenase expression/formation protein HypE [Pseudomonadota bacterium]